EDEGKVMALATYAYPIPDEQNPLIEFFSIDGTRVRAKYGPLRMYDELKRALWYFPSEQFAYMAQRALEIHIAELVRNAVKKTGFGDLALAGGVASNIKVNMLLRDLPEVGEVFVFPHMGDGGLAVGAALQAAADADAKPNGRLDDIFWGPDCPIGDTAVPAEVTTHAFSETGEVVDFTAARLAEGEIVLWYQGRMEYGPRALGNRSILARPDLPEMRDRLNLQLKKRVWYQPFCPSMLDSEAGWLLENADGLPNRFMTSGYRVRPSVKNFLQGVLGVDGSCRPQFVAADASPYASLLDAMRQRMGTGCVLNTSMNVHGEPLVWTLDQAFKLMVDSRFHYLICPCEKKVFELKGSGSG
ncbi:MAG: hypothetical protein QG656_1162, partial [Candidatus Hydrogenedentes bacterium]|nr:hypothetical protein [Candidatus Hydrogenedentota bacterium]